MTMKIIIYLVSNPNCQLPSCSTCRVATHWTWEQAGAGTSQETPKGSSSASTLSLPNRWVTSSYTLIFFPSYFFPLSNHSNLQNHLLLEIIHQHFMQLLNKGAALWPLSFPLTLILNCLLFKGNLAQDAGRRETRKSDLFCFTFVNKLIWTIFVKYWWASAQQAAISWATDVALPLVKLVEIANPAWLWDVQGKRMRAV